MSGERFVVQRHWKRWAVYDQAEIRGDALSVHDTREQAEVACARRNKRDNGQQIRARRAS
jgi:hypothetical protein